jgi:hypothetical protein
MHHRLETRSAKPLSSSDLLLLISPDSSLSLSLSLSAEKAKEEKVKKEAPKK